MRRRKLSVGWCIRLYYSDRNCKYSLYFVHIHAYANTNSRESVGKFNTFFQIFYFSGKYFTLKFSIWFCNFSKIAWAKNFVFWKFQNLVFSVSFDAEKITIRKVLWNALRTMWKIYFSRDGICNFSESNRKNGAFQKNEH